MVRDFRPYDDETPIENYPGFFALEWDESDLFTDTEELLDFWRESWTVYDQTLVDEGLERDLVVHLASGATRIHVEAGRKLALVLDQLPAFDVYFDGGPSDAGPASGSGYVIFLTDQASMEDVKSTIEALADAISKRPQGRARSDLQRTRIPRLGARRSSHQPSLRATIEKQIQQQEVRSDRLRN